MSAVTGIVGVHVVGRIVLGQSAIVPAVRPTGRSESKDIADDGDAQG
jgi:hypothetical protein